MTITKDAVVSFNYVLTNDKGEVIDESKEHPLSYLHGHRNIVPGLEKALEGLAVGASTEAKVSPEEGYGEYNPQLKFAVARAQFGADVPPAGSLVQLRGQQGQQMVAQVLGHDEQAVQLDANHPLAGENLNFKVTITEVRQAQPEELAHGHVRGPGGHQH